MKRIKSNIVVFLLLFLMQIICVHYCQAAVLRGVAVHKPWSSYWWQTTLGKLVKGYHGHPAPMEKYDLYVDGIFPGSATLSGNSVWFDPEAPSWFGLCNAWVNASILETGEIYSSSQSGVFFAIGDKKGFLCACHAEDEINYKRCQNNPEFFHRYLLDYLGEQGIAIGADLDPSEEFWSYPIYSYEMEIVSGADYDQVKCTVAYADDLGVEPDYCGTVEVFKTYDYILEKDATGAYLVGGGQWRGASLNDHPETVWIPVAVVPEEMFLDYKTVTDIVSKRGDGLEDTNSLFPGHHLVMPFPLAERTFKLCPQPGEKFICSLALDKQSPEASRGFYTLKKNSLIISEDEFKEDLLSLEIEGSSEDEYELILYTEAGGDKPAFIHLYVAVETEYESYFLDVPNSLNWFGTAFAGLESGRTWLQILGSHGLPLAGSEVFEIESESRQLNGQVGRIPFDYFKDGEPVAIKLSSTTPLSSMFLFGNQQNLWGGGGKEEVRQDRLVVPWLTKISNFYEKERITLVNRETESLNIDIKYFSKDGELNEQLEYLLAGKKIANFMPGAYPGDVNVKGWALLTPDGDGLDGCVIHEGWGHGKELLPLLGLANEFAVTLLAVDAGWQTTVNLYNVNATETIITLRLHSFQISPETEMTITMAPWSSIEQSITAGLWGLDDGDLSGAWIEVKAKNEIAGCFSFRYLEEDVASLPLVNNSLDRSSNRMLVHIANNDSWWTGMAVTNLIAEEVEFNLVALDNNGHELEREIVTLNGYEGFSELAHSRFRQDLQPLITSIKLEGGRHLAAIAIYGTIIGELRFTAVNW